MSVITRYVGIDPGVNGGVAYIDSCNDFMGVYLANMPETESAICNYLRNVTYGNKNLHVVIEKVHGYVGKNSVGPHMFTFGMNYGGIRMLLLADNIQFDAVTPQAWQKELGIKPRPKGMSDNKWKNYLKDFAMELYPDVPITLKTADALLIARYCRKRYTGE